MPTCYEIATEMTPPEIDPGRCPLCGATNECGMVSGAATCWCFSMSIPPEVMDALPPEARGVACVCKSCAGGARKGSVSVEQLEEKVRKER
jgi:hypothetical protein